MARLDKGDGTEALCDVSNLSLCNTTDSLGQGRGQDMEWSCELYSCVVHGVILGAVCLLGLLGNSLSFIVFWRDPVKSSTHFLLQTLAVVDSLLLLTALPLHSIPAYLIFAEPLIYKSYVQSIYPFVAVFIYPLAMINQTLTIWTTVLIGLNRVSIHTQG